MHFLVAQTAVFGLLAWAGAAHLRHLPLLRDTLGHHGFIPAEFSRPAAAFIATWEFLIGIGGLAALFAARSERAVFVAALVALGLYVLYAVYAGALLARRPGVLCGCSPGLSERVTTWTVGRAVVLACAAAFAALFAGSGIDFIQAGAETAAAVVAAMTFVILASTLPAAVTDPVIG